MEFLERHPEKRAEIYQRMRENRFAWGASYVQCQEVHVGPEKLVRQFYYGRRWLRQNFPGVDTRTYFKTDPPSLTLQMPQILRKAGVKYLSFAKPVKQAWSANLIEDDEGPLPVEGRWMRAFRRKAMGNSYRQGGVLKSLEWRPSRSVISSFPERGS
jgi:hypothetical protein